MSKIEIRLQLSSDFFMFSKLLAIICSESMQAIRNRLQQVNQGLAYQISGSLLDFSEQSKTRFAFDQGHNRLVVSFAHHSINFPITKTLALLDDRWPFLNTHPVRQLATPIISTATFATFLLTA